MPVKFKTKAMQHSTKAKAAAAPDADGVDHEPAFLIQDFAENYISFHVHKATAGPRKARHHNVVHASDLDPVRQWCPREPALLTKLNMKRPDTYLTTAQKMVFEWGHAGADMLIGLLPDNVVWGNWQCGLCESEVSFSYRPKKCTKCDAHGTWFGYREVFVRDPTTGVVGSIDLMVDLLGNGVKIPVEIKTEGNETFKGRSKPTFEHEWRTMLYLRLIAADPHMKKHGVSTLTGRVVYLCKEGFEDAPRIKEWGLPDAGKSSIKEYWVKRNDDMVENQMDLARTYRKWRTAFDMGGALPLPPRISKCTSQGCARATQCPVRVQCWKHPE